MSSTSKVYKNERRVIPHANGALRQGLSKEVDSYVKIKLWNTEPMAAICLINLSETCLESAETWGSYPEEELCQSNRLRIRRRYSVGDNEILDSPTVPTAA